MKKLIIAVLAAMVFAGTAFAAGIGVEIQGGVNLADGSTTKVGNATTANTQDVAAVKARGWFIRNRITASGEYGKFGAWFRYDANSYWGGQSGTGNVWWKPVDQFRLLIGGNPDGLFGATGLTGYDFYNVAGDVRVANAGNFGGGGYYFSNLTFNDAFYGGWTAAGALFTICPVQGLEINAGIPFITETVNITAADIYQETEAQAAYTINGIGKAALTYVGSLNKLGITSIGPMGTGSKLFGYFGLTAFKNVSFDFGVGYTIPISQGYYTYYAPVAVGLGANINIFYNFGIKARVMGEFGESYKIGANVEKGTFRMKFDILPYYAITNTLQVYLSAGMGYFGKDPIHANTTSTDILPGSAIGWHVNPYISVSSPGLVPNLYAGFQIYDDGLKDVKDKNYISWAIPIGMSFNF